MPATRVPVQKRVLERTAIVVSATLWPTAAFAHPDPTSAAGSRAYLISAAIVAVAVLAVGVVNRALQIRAERRDTQHG